MIQNIWFKIKSSESTKRQKLISQKKKTEENADLHRAVLKKSKGKTKKVIKWVSSIFLNKYYGS